MNSMLCENEDSFLFAFSDEDLPISSPTKCNPEQSPPKCNPVEEHLRKELSSVQTRIKKTKDDIKEVRDMTNRTLTSLYSQILYGKDTDYNSESDLYTINGEPVVKKAKKSKETCSEFIQVGKIWSRIFSDKWVLGIPLINCSQKTLSNIQIYVSLNEDDEIYGASTIWKFANEGFWNRTNKIKSSESNITQVSQATVVLDLPKFDTESFCKVYGTISYEIYDQQYQTLIPVINFTIENAMDNNYQVRISTKEDCTYLREQWMSNNTSLIPIILTLKSTSFDRIIDIHIDQDPERKQKIKKFLEKNAFLEICPDVYIAYRCLAHCLVEILHPNEGKQWIRISTRSSQQMNIILKLLKDKFSDLSTDQDRDSLRAAMILMEELKLYIGDASSAERQKARMKTDLLIP